MADINKIKAGDVLWSIEKHYMGSTLIRTVSVFECVVKEVDAERRRALIAWNGNRPRWTYNVKPLRTKKPLVISTGFMGQQRLARRGEKGGAA